MAADMIHLLVPIAQVLTPDMLMAKAPRKRVAFRNATSPVIAQGALSPVIARQQGEGASASVIARPAGASGRPGRSNLLRAFNQLE